MGNLLQEMLAYLSNATPEQLAKDWEELSPFSQIGPTATDFIACHTGKYPYNLDVVRSSLINNKKNPEYSSGFFF